MDSEEVHWADTLFKAVLSLILFGDNSTETSDNTRIDPRNVTVKPEAPCQFKNDALSMALIICFTIIFTLSVVGNCLVIVTIAQNRWMRTVTNMFLQSLAISDLLVSVICMPPTMTGLLFNCFLWGEAMCKLINFLQPVAVSSSAYMLVAIALERYNAICRPLQSRHWKTKSHAIKVIVAVWVVSLVISSPGLFVFKIITLPRGGFNCRDNPANKDWNDMYFVYLLVVFFCVPLLLMIGLYSAVTYTLWRGIRLDSSSYTADLGSMVEEKSSIRQRMAATKPIMALRRFGRSIRDRSRNGTMTNGTSRRMSGMNDSPSKSTSSGGGQPTHTSDQKYSVCGQGPPPALRSTHSEKNLEAKKRVIIMLFVIVAEFIICWIPLYISLILFRMGHIDMPPIWLLVFFLTLAYVSSCTNPITYCFLNLKFRQAFLLAFGCRFMVKETSMFRHPTVPVFRNTAGPVARRMTCPQNMAKAESHSQLRTVEGLVIQEPMNTSKLGLPLIQMRSPSFREASDCKLYDSDEDLAISEHENSRMLTKNEDRPITNGRSLSPVQEKLTTV